MADISITKLDSDVPFDVTFQPVDSKGSPVAPTGPIVVTNGDPSIVTVAPHSAGSPTFQFTLTGKAGLVDVTFKDNVSSATAHLSVQAGAESGAKLIVS